MKFHLWNWSSSAFKHRNLFIYNSRFFIFSSCFTEMILQPVDFSKDAPSSLNIVRTEMFQLSKYVRAGAQQPYCDRESSRKINNANRLESSPLFSWNSYNVMLARFEPVSKFSTCVKTAFLSSDCIGWIITATTEPTETNNILRSGKCFHWTALWPRRKTKNQH